MNRWIRGLTRGPEAKPDDRPGRARMPAGHGLGAPAPHLERGDRARERKAWPEAVAHYRDHLRAHPNDAAIWIQLGHAAKEGGDFLTAKEAYRTAQSLNPDDPEVCLQIGHLMKLAGRTGDAIASYGAALKLLPTSAAYRELVTLGQGAWADRVVGEGTLAATPRLYLQINDLLHFLRLHKTPSGIQRVQLGILAGSLDDRRTARGMHVEFVFNMPDDTRLWQVSRLKLHDLVDHIHGLEVEQATLRAMIDDIVAAAVVVTTRPCDSFVILGAFWSQPDNTLLLNEVRKSGASIGIYIYDIIPITWPEYCASQLVIEFTSDFCEALQIIDFALAISDFTKREIEKFSLANGFPRIPIEVVPLAHSLTTSPRGFESAAMPFPNWSGQIRTLKGREFVLCVCTIEPRKNHRYLYDIWKVLKEEGVSVPDLVLVGRKGWYVDDFFAQLRNSDYLGGSIVVLHDLSDVALATLYGACLFTAFPSIIEGWGLPVGESLSHGKLCVSSRASSMPEVGGDLVAYVDPLNLREGIAVFRGLLDDRDAILAWERRIGREFEPRGWDEVTDRLIDAATRLHADRDDAVDTPLAKLTSGTLLCIGQFSRSARLRSPRAYAGLDRLVLGDSFYSPEDGGAWMRGEAGTILCRTDLPAGCGVVCYLQIKGAPNISEASITVSGAVDERITRPLAAHHLDTWRLPCTVSSSGDLTLALRFAGECRGHDPDQRDFRLMLVSFGFVDAKDAIGRSDMLERIMFDEGGVLRRVGRP